MYLLSGLECFSRPASAFSPPRSFHGGTNCKEKVAAEHGELVGRERLNLALPSHLQDISRPTVRPLPNSCLWCHPAGPVPGGGVLSS